MTAMPRCEWGNPHQCNAEATGLADLNIAGVRWLCDEHAKEADWIMHGMWDALSHGWDEFRKDVR